MTPLASTIGVDDNNLKSEVLCQKRSRYISCQYTTAHFILIKPSLLHSRFIPQSPPNRRTRGLALRFKYNGTQQLCNNYSVVSRACFTGISFTIQYIIDQKFSMSITPINKLVLRSLLRQATVLRKNNSSIWLQSFPSIEEFQTVSATSPYQELSLFVRAFPEPIREFILDNIPTRLLDGNEFKRIILAGFRLNPLSQSTDPTGHTLECLKIMNNQVFSIDLLVDNRFLF